MKVQELFEATTETGKVSEGKVIYTMNINQRHNLYLTQEKIKKEVHLGTSQTSKDQKNRGELVVTFKSVPVAEMSEENIKKKYDDIKKILEDSGNLSRFYAQGAFFSRFYAQGAYYKIDTYLDNLPVQPIFAKNCRIYLNKDSSFKDSAKLLTFEGFGVLMIENAHLITSNVLGICKLSSMFKELQITLSTFVPRTDGSLNWLPIVCECIDRKGSILDCQEQLIKNGFKELARL